jgi:hypothetical protein
MYTEIPACDFDQASSLRFEIAIAIAKEAVGRALLFLAECQALA